MSIAVDGVSFSYGARQALDDVSFELAAGRFNALLGPNGAGKSTLFALLTRLYSIQQGEVRIDGQSLSHHPSAVMRQLGVVFQQSALDLDLTVEQNMMYHGSLHGLSRAQTREQMMLELDRLDMAERLKDKVRGLNGGHRRRLEIARALLHQPRTLLLDEPTVGLDPASRRLINEHVHGLCESDGLTVIWATHLIEEVGDDDPVVVLVSGQVKAHDTSRAICEHESVPSLAEAFAKLSGRLEAA